MHILNPMRSLLLKRLNRYEYEHLNWKILILQKIVQILKDFIGKKSMCQTYLHRFYLDWDTQPGPLQGWPLWISAFCHSRSKIHTSCSLTSLLWRGGWIQPFLKETFVICTTYTFMQKHALGILKISNKVLLI